MEKNTGKVREFCHPGKVGTLRVFWNEKTGLHQTIFPPLLRNYFETV